MKLVDLRGKRFGKLVVMGRVPVKKRTRWTCRCDCGVSVDVYAQNLLTGNTTTCGCSGRGRQAKIDLTGQKFGRLTVLSQRPSRGRGTSWNCLCECGGQAVKDGYALRNGDVKTCGCGSHPLKYADPSRRSFNELLAQYKRNAKRTGREFHLTADEFRSLTSSNCHYCNAPPSQLGCFRDRMKATGAQPYLANGIDRMSNDDGYTLANSVPCCKRCNWMKSELSREEFLLHMQKILAHLGSELA